MKKNYVVLVLVLFQIVVSGMLLSNPDTDSSMILSKNGKFSKLIFVTKYTWDIDTWNYSTRDWYERDVSSKIITWQLQDFKSSYFSTTKTYVGTYYTERYELINADYWFIKPSKPDHSWGGEVDTWKYDLSERLLENNYHEFVMGDVMPNYDEVSTTTYTYNGDLLDNVLKTYLYDSPSSYIDNAFKTYYYYDTQDRISSKNYYDFETNEMLERTNWTYADSSSTAIKEVKDQYDVWNPVRQYIYYYNAFDEIVKEERYNWSGSDWLLYQVDLLRYFEGGLLKEIITQNYNASTAQFTNSIKIEYDYVTTLTTPSAPDALEATNITYDSFTANWTSSPVATWYYLDVATDSLFVNFLDGFNNKNVSNVTSITVSGLNPLRNYYYRVRAGNGNLSNNSNIIEVTTHNSLFTLISTNLKDVAYSSIDWGDYDSDGDLDILLTGAGYPPDPISKIYQNNSGIFTDINAGLTGVKNGSVDWGDYDNDGDLDILLTGLTSYPYPPITKIYRNDSGVFTDINAELIEVNNGDVEWGDYDNDGDLDALICNNIYRNNNGSFTNINAGIPSSTSYSVSWGDFDNDKDLDILLNNNVYRNNNGSFTNINAGLPNVEISQWGDYDNDGDIDILSSYVDKIIIYTNESGVFNNYYEAILTSQIGAMSWADYDNDGDLDVLVTGGHFEWTGSTYYSDVLLNESGILSKIETPLYGYEESANTWADYDNDGDLDILISGGETWVDDWGTVFSGATRMYRSNISITNTKPNSPTNLSTVLTDSTITFFWDKATDKETPQDGLSYNIYIGGSSLSEEINPSMSNINTGYRKVVQLGNVNQNTSWTIKNLPTGVYYWSVQALDNGYTGSEFSTEHTFTINIQTDFTETNLVSDSLYFSSTAWGDYDSDGDMDLFFGGEYKSGNKISKIYRNDSGDFAVTNTGIIGLSKGSADWGDFDNDGNIDILTTGSDQTNNRVSKIYQNSLGVFIDINAGLEGVYQSSCSWGDYDNDGDLDILLTGNTVSGNISKIYRNDSGNFTDINAGLEGVNRSSCSWGDYDKDGDLDILLTGDTGSNNISRIYRNDSGIFVDINAGLEGVNQSSCSWGDFDKDGDLDILLTGDTGSNNISRIYRNDSGIFVDINAGLEGVSLGSSSCGDYDNDGNLDILLTGWDGSGRISRIYNNSYPAFLEISSNILGIESGSSSFVDYDNDGDLDILLTGDTDSGSISNMYINECSKSGICPMPPINLRAHANGNEITFEWDTYSKNLSFNLYISSTSMTENINPSMSNLSNGYRKVVKPGNACQNTSWTIKDFKSGGSVYWSVQTVDNCFKGSEFADEQTTSDGFTDINAGLAGVYRSSAVWGDYDNDGDLDILITGYTGSAHLSNIYRNDNGSFIDIDAGLTGVYYSSTDWGDYDNDGDLDILITGHTGSSGISKIYRNDSGDFTDINAGLPGVYRSSVTWGDYDNDGDLDILITGYTGSAYISKIYRNDSGVFTDINAELIGVYYSSADWGDYDNDGDLDLIITGSNGTSAILNIYRNDDGLFTDINAGLTGVFYSSADWGDYDNDGDLDLIITGATGSVGVTKIYRNDDGLFTDINAGLPGVYYSSADWGDYDNDGDLDLIITGYTGSVGISKIYSNDTGGFTGINAGLEGAMHSSVAWGDYDNDGDLDFLLTGSSGTGYISKLYRNDLFISKNTTPNTPTNLSTVLTDNTITFSWDKATDYETSQNGLSYNLYIGTESLTGNTLCSMSSIPTGYRKIVGNGNSQQNTLWTIKDLEPGTYYWSVQSIDNGFAGSEFASEQTFIVTGIEDESISLVTELLQNYPNPFNPDTVIKYTLLKDANVKLKIFNIAGKEVSSLVDQKQNKGWHEAKFKGDKLTSGMYFYRLSVDNKVISSKKMLLLK